LSELSPEPIPVPVPSVVAGSAEPVAAAPVALNSSAPCPCDCAEPRPSRVRAALSTAAREVVTLVHPHAFEVGLRRALPGIALRVVVAAGGSVETAKLVEQALRALGV